MAHPWGPPGGSTAERSPALAVAQSVEQKTWDQEPLIPTDDSAVLTMILPLVAILMVYGALLLSSLHRSACDLPKENTLISMREP